MIKPIVQLIVLSLLNHRVHSTTQLETPTIHTENGWITGAKDYDRRGNVFLKFLGVPYAKAPVGEFRFKAAMEADNWQGVRHATSFAPNCPQGHITSLEDEDCLYLNVYIPQPMTNVTGSKPVMVYIYGGGFLTGSSTSENLGPDNLMTTDIILVTFNFRVGVLGFVWFDDPALSVFGNEGLKDQVVLLKWIQRNIAAFGGDPRRVTIVGNSSGGSCVHAHLMSKLSNGLFHRAILESGSMLYLYHPPLTARMIAESLTSNQSTPKLETDQDVFDVLNATDGQDLYWALKNLTGHDTIKLGPIIESIHSPNAFLREDPLETIAKREYNDVPVIVGYNCEEGLVNYPEYPTFTLLRNDFVYSKLFGFRNYTKVKKDPRVNEYLLRVLKRFYSDETFSKMENYLHLIMDVDYFVAISDAIRIHHLQAKANSYVYRFCMDSSINYEKAKKNLTFLRGACHADELGYIFHQARYPKITPGSREDLGIDIMVTFWSNFVKTGNPNHPNNTFRINWLPANEHFQYLDLNFNLTTRHAIPEQYRLDFWADFRRENRFLEDALEKIFVLQGTGNGSKMYYVGLYVVIVVMLLVGFVVKYYPKRGVFRRRRRLYEEIE